MLLQCKEKIAKGTTTPEVEFCTQIHSKIIQTSPLSSSLSSSSPTSSRSLSWSGQLVVRVGIDFLQTSDFPAAVAISWLCQRPDCKTAAKYFSNWSGSKVLSVVFYVRTRIFDSDSEETLLILKLLHGFVHGTCFSHPLPGHTKLKFDQDFLACESFCFWS